jgi:hypothetical protein
MGQELLDLELRLLMLRHGRTRLLESLAHLEGTTPDEIERLISQIEASQPRKKRKEPPSVEVLVDRLAAVEPERREKILSLAREYERGRFLPQLRDAIRFCHQRGLNVRPKSRRDLLPRIVSALADLPNSILEKMLLHSGEDGSFGRLANAIMKGS